ncbi:diguanylate cyclase [Neobacillus sp. MM2021_6]|uniref:sensor domain-containing protein n=1 Tax=Bacillaceae TaxID=186817 RepID=UPI00140E29A5|nr:MULTISPECIES: sensor domain-containing diguanylate cyclase [Bacillaceae]MBO0959001.1 diguanylate cyclase [Neobacillus sp. MM2021_6]NHC17731.1 diguanylate cyclase [Bacillus sp. MM2020_4]
MLDIYFKDLNKNNLLLKLFNDMSDLVYLTKVGDNNTLSYELANVPAMEFSGLTAESFGKPLNEVVTEKVYKVIEAKYREAMIKGEPITYEQQMKLPPNLISDKYPSRQIVHWESKITPVYNQSGVCTHLLAVVRDIHDRKQKEYELKRANDRFELVWNSVADVMYTFDKNQRFRAINKAFEKLLGWSGKEILNDGSISIIPNGSQEDLNVIIGELKKGKIIPSYETQRLSKDGKIVEVLASYSPLYDSDGNWDGAIAVYKDISERKKYEAELKKLALQDPLTGLLNRTALSNKIGAELERAKSTQKTLAVFFLDIDRFKEVNDTMGHDIGDEIIKEFARRVKGCIRRKDLFARLGGDEFIILLNDLNDQKEAIQIAQRIIDSFQSKWVIKSFETKISSSIGIAFFTDFKQEVRELLKHADIALYKAKEKGRNNFQLYQ